MPSGDVMDDDCDVVSGAGSGSVACRNSRRITMPLTKSSWWALAILLCLGGCLSLSFINPHS